MISNFTVAVGQTPFSTLLFVATVVVAWTAMRAMSQQGASQEIAAAA